MNKKPARIIVIILIAIMFIATIVITIAFQPSSDKTNLAALSEWSFSTMIYCSTNSDI